MPVVGGLCGLARALAEQLAEDGYDATYTELPGIDHGEINDPSDDVGTVDAIFALVEKVSP